ncbi:MAG: hypothetical protein WC498_00460 [Candidatus Saccharimonadales bacterium]
MAKGATQLSQEVVALTDNGFSRQQVRAPIIHPGDYRWPELRIARQAIWDDPGNGDWDSHLNDLGHQNRRRGKARVLGEVACTYISDQEIRHMLLTDNPDLRHDLQKAKAAYRGLGRRVNQFIHETSRDHLEIEELIGYGERFGVTASEVAFDRPKQIRGAWVKSSFSIGHLDGFGHHQIGIDLSANKELAHERQGIIKYLATEEKLPTNFIDPEWEPHAIIYDVHPHLKAGELALKYSIPRPDNMIFTEPHACSDV